MAVVAKCLQGTVLSDMKFLDEQIQEYQACALQNEGPGLIVKKSDIESLSCQAIQKAVKSFSTDAGEEKCEHALFKILAAASSEDQWLLISVLGPKYRAALIRLHDDHDRESLVFGLKKNIADFERTVSSAKAMDSSGSFWWSVLRV